MKTPHINFYNNCIKRGVMPTSGLCTSADHGYIDYKLLSLFKPTLRELRNSGHHLDDGNVATSFWGSEVRYDNNMYVFTEFRQTIILFMAAMNDEL